MVLASQPVQARGPATGHPLSLAADNPYNFPPQLLAAAKLPPRITDTHIYFFGYEGDDSHVCFQQCKLRALESLKGTIRNLTHTARVSLCFLGTILDLFG